MTEPKRRFWQLHLSTAVVLMLLASFVLWLNFRIGHIGWIITDGHDMIGNYIVNTEELRGDFSFDTRGWPFCYNVRLADDNGTGRYFPFSIYGNLIVLFALLVSVALVSERFVRRHEARKQ